MAGKVGGLLPENHIMEPGLPSVVGDDPDGRDIDPWAGGFQLGCFDRLVTRCPNARCSSPMGGGDGSQFVGKRDSRETPVREGHGSGDVPLCNLLALAVGSHARSDLSASRRVPTGLVDIP